MSIAVALLLIALLSLLPATVHAGDADSVWSQLMDGTVSGRARLYDNRRWNDENAPYPNQPQDSGHDSQATVLGGDVLLRSGSVGGFSAGVSVFTQQRLIHYAEPNPYLPPLNQLAESYLQFQKSKLQLRFGRQMLSTPFANGDAFSLTTRSFYGFTAALHLLDSGEPPAAPFNNTGPDGNPPSGFDPAVKPSFSYDAKSAPADLKLHLARITRYMSRFSDGFADVNRYGPGLHMADPAVPDATPGFFSTGLEYRHDLADAGVMARAWYYTFFDYARLQYYEAGWQGAKWGGDGPRPMLALQYTTEGDTGAARAGPVDADLYGLKLGLNLPKGDVLLLAEYSPDHPGSFRDGGLLHAYTDLSGVLYDDATDVGLEDLGPGRGFGVQVDCDPGKHASSYLRLMHYVADYGANGSLYDYSGPAHFSGDSLLGGQLVPDQSGNELDLGFAVQPGGGDWSLGDDLVFRSGFGGRNTFVEDRLRLVYTF
ncbi:MAG TPA: hypothetical protein VF651_00445 [Gammaproteobacteria bacterium]